MLAEVVEDGGNETLSQGWGASAIFVNCDVSKWSDADAMVAIDLRQARLRVQQRWNRRQGGCTHKCTEENWKSRHRDQPDGCVAMHEGRDRADAQVRRLRGDTRSESCGSMFSGAFANAR